jgi:hypothetical protein
MTIRTDRARRAWVFGVAVAAFVSACSVESPREALRQSAAEIQGGTSDTGDAPVGLFLFTDGSNNVHSCTGTMIAPDIVLTAGHCVDRVTVNDFYTGNGAPQLESNWTVPSGMVDHAVDATYVFLPGADYRDDPGDDVALLHLANPECSITPWTLAPSAAGGTCNTVGFGRNTVNQTTYHWEKRRATGTVNLGDSGPSWVTVDPLNGGGAAGDSGGPLSCAPGTVAGVFSSIPPNATPPTQSYYARTDSARADLATWISQWEFTPVPPGNCSATFRGDWHGDWPACGTNEVDITCRSPPVQRGAIVFEREDSNGVVDIGTIFAQVAMCNSSNGVGNGVVDYPTSTGTITYYACTVDPNNNTRYCSPGMTVSVTPAHPPITCQGGDEWCESTCSCDIARCAAGYIWCPSTCSCTHFNYCW